MIRKLNKKAIYWCLVGMIGLSVPAIYSLASSTKNDDRTVKKGRDPQPNLHKNDVRAISGTEQFPDTYGDVKEFEKDNPKVKSDEAQLREAFANLESETRVQGTTYYSSTGPRGHNDDPWQEAQKQELKQRAFDHYGAKRSDILFVDNLRTRPRQVGQTDSDDDIIKMMDKAMAIAEKSASQPSSNPHDMFFANRQNHDNHKGFLGGKRDVGAITNPSAHMLSEGTLIHAILLSEINTDLPGPILARVSHNIWDSKTGQTLLIPQNSKLIGEYNSTVGNGQTRAQIVWTRIIYPNQQSVDLGRMVGVDKKGTSGSVGAVDNHYDKVALGLIMTTALSSGVRMTQGKYDPNSANMVDEVGQSLAQETSRLGSRITDKMLSIKPTITVPMGEQLNVFVEQDLHLQPYDG